MVRLFSNSGSADEHTLAVKGTLKALLCPVLSCPERLLQKEPIKVTEWWVVGAQVVKVRDSLQVAPRTRNRNDGGSITDCSYQSRIFS